MSFIAFTSDWIYTKIITNKHKFVEENGYFNKYNQTYRNPQTVLIHYKSVLIGIP